MSFLGTPRIHFRRVDSTNARARALAEAGAPHGTTVTADEQPVVGQPHRHGTAGGPYIGIDNGQVHSHG